ncbi:solute:proton antiporter [Aureococcus anophagefferens]|nr:solute:proton antiporter [Aureococcus anophagefferens]
MGLELSLERLSALKREILGIGVAQMAATTAALASLAGWCLRTGAGAPLDLGAQLVVGASLALSSSAFALQLLRDKDDLATAHGRAALGVLLLQDLAVVPLLVVILLLASGGAGIGGGAVAGAVLGAAVKGLVSLAAVELIGKRAIDSLFYFAAQSRSQEAFLAVVLLTVLAMSATTEAVGLSATLGAFLAGVSLSETRYRYQVEADVAPFRGMLLGLFFVTVGFSIDPRLIVEKPLAVAAATGGLVATKAVVLASLGLAFRVPASAALRAGLLLGPGGEFGFVAFGLATKFLVLDAATAEFLRTTTALSMALTPVLASAGERLQEPVNNWAAKLARRTRRERDDEAAVLASKQGDDLDRQRRTVVVALRRLYPDLEIIARAENRDHQRRLSKMLGVVAMVPALPEDSRFLTLPFGGAVLRALNYDQSDVDMLIEESRRSALGIMSGSTDTLVAEEQSSMLEQLGMNDGEAAVVDVGDGAEEEPKVAA